MSDRWTWRRRGQGRATVLGGGLLARSRHGTSSPYGISGTSYYHADGNGNITYLASSTGSADAAYRYDPFGRWLAHTGAYAAANGMRYSSKPWLGHNGSNTDGLYYYGYRFYEPLTQRWLNRDPFFAELNTGFPFNGVLVQANAILASEVTQLYSFAHNSPINTFDTDGVIAPLPMLLGGLAIGNCAIGAWELKKCFECMDQVRALNELAAERLDAEKAYEWCSKNRGNQCTPLFQDAAAKGLRCGLWGAGRFLLVKIGLNPIIGGKIGGG